MISYYELLGMVKDKTNQKKVKHDGNIFEWNTFNYFNDNIGEHLTRRLNEMDMFEKNIEIIDKDIEEIKMNGVSFYSEYVESWISKENNEAFNEYLANKLNEVIREVNKLRKGCN